MWTSHVHCYASVQVFMSCLDYWIILLPNSQPNNSVVAAIVVWRHWEGEWQQSLWGGRETASRFSLRPNVQSWRDVKDINRRLGGETECLGNGC